MKRSNLDTENLEAIAERYTGNFELTEEVLKYYNLVYSGNEYDSCKSKSELRHNRKMKFLNIIKHKRFNGVPSGDIKEGFIYVASNPAYPSKYKIGRTLEPLDRISQFNVLCPNKGWRLETWYASFDMRKAEASILNLLASPNCKGEWTGRKLSTIQGVMRNHHLLDNWENLPEDIKFSIY
ncbi:hypothetical protein NVP1121O_254 [Vibrio phage 1.121.O._10N.286.46.C4]|nr:hypothetical protein NVP1121O_254 [Vibrio phage 1.121.O._10N.286.46.C4]